MKKRLIVPIIVLTGMIAAPALQASADPATEKKPLAKWLGNITPKKIFSASKIVQPIASNILELVRLEKTSQALSDLVKATDALAKEFEKPKNEQNVKKIAESLTKYSLALHLVQDDALKIARILSKIPLTIMKYIPFLGTKKITVGGKKMTIIDALEQLAARQIEAIFRGLDYSQKINRHILEMLKEEEKPEKKNNRTNFMFRFDFFHKYTSIAILFDSLVYNYMKPIAFIIAHIRRIYHSTY